MALSCDYRIMREDRGWFCISEVDVGVPVPPAMMGILRAKLPANTARDALLTGKRYTAEEAIAAGIADGKAPADQLLAQAEGQTLFTVLGHDGASSAPELPGGCHCPARRRLAEVVCEYAAPVEQSADVVVCVCSQAH
jgi:hypothetical protein